MFEETSILFLHAVTPVHMGAGAAVGGLIDNPIQRERHTGHPLFAGSGLKGAIREYVESRRPSGWDDQKITLVFGPPTSSAHEHAGAAAFSDAQLLLFPIRSLKCAYVYATSPTALARASRLLSRVRSPSWTIPPVEEGRALASSKQPLVGEDLVLETFTYPAQPVKEVSDIARWLAQHAFPSDHSYDYFRQKVLQDLVLLHDTDFSHFVETGTVVEPHVRIDDASGTADEGGLFYTENLPPESVMIAALMTSRTRGKQDNSVAMDARAVADLLKATLDGTLVQIGGDATTGRGQVVIRVTS